MVRGSEQVIRGMRGSRVGEYGVLEEVGGGREGRQLKEVGVVGESRVG